MQLYVPAPDHDGIDFPGALRRGRLTVACTNHFNNLHTQEGDTSDEIQCCTLQYISRGLVFTPPPPPPFDLHTIYLIKTSKRLSSPSLSDATKEVSSAKADPGPYHCHMVHHTSLRVTLSLHHYCTRKIAKVKEHGTASI